MGLDFMTNLDYNVQADNLKCKQPEQNVEKSRSLVERARLEIVYTPQGYRGFESLLLRHKSTVILKNYGGLFIPEYDKNELQTSESLRVQQRSSCTKRGKCQNGGQ